MTEIGAVKGGTAEAGVVESGCRVIVTRALVVAGAVTFLLVVVSLLLAFFPLPASVVDDVACVPVAVDVVVSVSAPVWTSSFPTGLGPIADRVAGRVSPST